jgi:two-component system chemotaxis response regulator CheB
MDGMTFIERVMKEQPRAIIAVSAYAEYGVGEIVFDSLDKGAVDFLAIPSSGLLDNQNLKADLISKIDMAGKIDPSQIVSRIKTRPQNIGHKHPEATESSTSRVLIVIGASTGGPKVITELLSKLPADLPACVLVIQHMPPTFTKTFARHLGSVSALVVREACDGDKLKDGIAYVAPGDFHMTVTKERTIKLTKTQKLHGVRPSINVSMITGSEVFGPNTMGILLTGMGQDGAFGMKLIKQRGGRTVAQDQSTSIVYGMPKAAADLGAVDVLAPSDAIPDLLCEYAMNRKEAARSV